MQNFALKLGIGGLTVAESIWGMVDPTAQLPRTPADLLIDIIRHGQADCKPVRPRRP